MMADAQSDVQLREAYRHCRQIARARARNFYFAFVALPRTKRDAICAVYAFMRRADDISDEPGLDLGTRREAMSAWLAAWKSADAGAVTSDLTFVALRDARRRFEIPSEWLDQLVEGTTLDLEEAQPAYATFDDLYRYCYLVASVVGLVCIRIFGYDDANAESLAEETGIAFQLTNILRDVAEDAAMGRVYLPDSDLSEFGLARNDLLSRQSPATISRVKLVMAQLAERAEEYYISAERLLPLIHEDSRPALWVLVNIYRRLLLRIKSNGFDVFSAKISLPLSEKLMILAQGLLQVLRQKVSSARP